MPGVEPLAISRYSLRTRAGNHRGATKPGKNDYRQNIEEMQRVDCPVELALFHGGALVA